MVIPNPVMKAIVFNVGRSGADGAPLPDIFIVHFAHACLPAASRSLSAYIAHMATASIDAMRPRQCNEKNCNDTVEKSSPIFTPIFMPVLVVVFVTPVSKIERIKIMQEDRMSVPLK